jgi:peptidoglycan/LPS O-acetylase OafA/YrhL
VPAAQATALRLRWLDGMKGISILWIVYFHFFGTWANRRFPSPIGADYFERFYAAYPPASGWQTLEFVIETLWVGLTSLGFHAVGVFLVLSGIGLTYSLARTGNPPDGWNAWYRARVLRLYPMYWAAHLVYLVSPFISRPEPLDYRFILSLLGERVWPIYTIFYYANPAWWYFVLILQLYIVFPILFRMLQRVGVEWFLVICALVTIASRYILLNVWVVSGDFVQGGFFACRLWEFAFGMVLGQWLRQNRTTLESRLFGPGSIVVGLAIYAYGLHTYGSLIEYTLTDALTSTGLFLLMAHFARWLDRLPRVAALIDYLGTYSYGLYLVHQPYVIYLGSRLRFLTMPEFTAVAAVIIAIIAYGSIHLERLVNAITERAFGRRKSAVQPLEAASSS